MPPVHMRAVPADLLTPAILPTQHFSPGGLTQDVHEPDRQLAYLANDPFGHYGGPAGWESKLVGTPA